MFHSLSSLCLHTPLIMHMYLEYNNSILHISSPIFVSACFISSEGDGRPTGWEIFEVKSGISTLFPLWTLTSTLFPLYFHSEFSLLLYFHSTSTLNFRFHSVSTLLPLYFHSISTLDFCFHSISKPFPSYLHLAGLGIDGWAES